MSPGASSGRSVRIWSATISSRMVVACHFLVLAGPRGGRGRAASSFLWDGREYIRPGREPRPAAQRGPLQRAGAAGPVGPGGSALVPAPRRQRATSPWCPERRTSGTPAPRNSGGRVYCGYSSSRSLNDSSSVESGSMAPGQQAQHGIDDDHRREVAARDDVVADRELEVDEAHGRGRRRPRSADRRARDAGRCARSRATRLVERGRRPGRAGSASPVRLGRDRLERRDDRLDAQDHAGATAVGIVVDGPVAAEAPLRAGRAREGSARPCSSARPGMLSPSGPGKSPGNSVMTSMRSRSQAIGGASDGGGVAPDGSGGIARVASSAATRLAHGRPRRRGRARRRRRRCGRRAARTHG